MNSQIAAFLAQDGITTGMIYALMALALILVFLVTRIIFIGQGEFASYSALTLASLQAGSTSGVVWLLLGLAGWATLLELRTGATRNSSRLMRALLVSLAWPVCSAGLAYWSAGQNFSQSINACIAVLTILPLGPLVYRVFFQPISHASTLILFIVSVGVHFVLMGLGLLFFGAEGTRSQPFTTGVLDLGSLSISAEVIMVVVVGVACTAGLYLLFEHTLFGKALRATAENRVGARLLGISSDFTGKASFCIASLLGAVSGVLISPIAAIYYDSGFLIGLKGFVAAVIGGLVSFPLGVAGALFVGMLESVSAFYASAYKEVIVFALLLPVLLWISLRARDMSDEEGV